MKSAAGKRFFKIILGLLIVLVLVLSDQISKQAAVEHLKNSADLILIPGVLQFHYLENTGAAFGLLGDYTLILSIITAVCVVVVLAAMIFYQKHSFFSRAAGILIVGGGIGNLIDRFWHGYVIDYISVSFFPPVFNLADCFVVIGVILFLIHFFFFTNKDKGREKIIRSRR